ncbi:THAP domain-containing protein 11 isoform X2 [Ixodes scapularis]|uniref:THAP domain-containing protein 11 isoform X2 n=1 Tax=Ixodes scapularis TaxID=6945 RepID=UPI001A9F1056|nr:THAP domain-containing protein 11 isoform X2 [Ixodes scapularis]
MTGGTTCCVPGCHNNTSRSRHVSWHRFPKNNQLRNVWVKRIDRKGTTGKQSLWTPTPNSRICGAHFSETGRKKYMDKAPRFFGTRTLPKYVAAHPSASYTGQHHMQLPQLLELQVCSLSNLDLGQTMTRPATQEPVQPGCPLIDDGAPDAGDVASNEPDYYEEYREPDSPVPPLTKEYTDVTRVTFHLGTESGVFEENRLRNFAAVAVKTEPQDPREVGAEVVSAGTGT